MNWGISARRKTKLRSQITIITLVLFSFILNACPPLEEDPIDKTLVYEGPLNFNKWMNILTSIERRGMPVTIDLSACTVPATDFSDPRDVLKLVREDGSTVPPGYTGKTYIQFHPYSGFPYGKELITSIILPNVATMISHAVETDIEVIPDEDFDSIKEGSAFRHFKRLRSITGEKIERIGNLAFVDSEALEEVKFNSVSQISQYAFYGCSALKEVHFEVANEILTSAFENCTSLERVNFPNVKAISQRAFKNCVSLIDVSFDTATKIGEDSFRDCTGLRSARFRANPPRTTTGHPILTSAEKITGDSVVFYENALRGCKSLELLDIRYAWNVFFSAGALANIGENLDLYLYDDNGARTYGHPQRELFLGEIRGSEKNGSLTVKAITISAPVVTPPASSQINHVDAAVKDKTGIQNYINVVYGEVNGEPRVNVTVKREPDLY